MDMKVKFEMSQPVTPITWATEQEVVEYYKLGVIEHCLGCHNDMEYNDDRSPSELVMLPEVELPDGRTAEVCCAIANAVHSIQN